MYTLKHPGKISCDVRKNGFNKLYKTVTCEILRNQGFLNKIF